MAASTSRIHGQTGVDDAFEGAADAELDAVEDGADVEPAAAEVDVGEDVDVEVEVDVEVDVDVDVEVVFVFVGAAVEVEVDVDVLIGDLLDAGASVVGGVVGASVVRVAVRVGRVGAEIVRETLGRFDPPPQDAARTASVSAIERARNARARSRRRLTTAGSPSRRYSLLDSAAFSCSASSSALASIADETYRFTALMLAAI
jgi:hypothetical protein